jgi:hypothetical protein
MGSFLSTIRKGKRFQVHSHSSGPVLVFKRCYAFDDLGKQVTPFEWFNLLRVQRFVHIGKDSVNDLRLIPWSCCRSSCGILQLHQARFKGFSLLRKFTQNTDEGLGAGTSHNTGDLSFNGCPFLCCKFL